MPNIFAYQDYRSFIRAWLGEGRNRTQRRLAKSLGCSEALISAFLSTEAGRKRSVSDQLRERMCELFQLDEQESAYLRLLILYAQTTDDEPLKTEIGRNLSILRKLHRARLMPEEHYRFFAMWEYGAILELSRCQQFHPTPKWIADRLVPKVTQSRVKHVLQDLISLELLRWTSDGRLLPTEEMINENWHADPEVRRKALKQRHSWSIRRSGRALATTPADQRHYSTLTFSSTQGRLAKIREILDQCMLHIADLVDSEVSEADQVFELDVHVFPLSKPTRSDSSADPDGAV